MALFVVENFLSTCVAKWCLTNLIGGGLMILTDALDSLSSESSSWSTSLKESWNPTKLIGCSLVLGVRIMCTPCVCYLFLVGIGYVFTFDCTFYCGETNGSEESNYTLSIASILSSYNIREICTPSLGDIRSHTWD